MRIVVLMDEGADMDAAAKAIAAAGFSVLERVDPMATLLVEGSSRRLPRLRAIKCVESAAEEKLLRLCGAQGGDSV